jgi:predicted ATPase/DNA-binding SARP family transcriptional activator
MTIKSASKSLSFTFIFCKMNAMSHPTAKTADLPALARLRLALLGPVQIERDGVPLSFSYNKVLALLAYLAVETGRAHRRAALADLLWPEQDETAARHSLSQALFSLRRTVGDDPANPLLLITRDTVRLNPNGAIWLDVTAFQGLLHGSAGSTTQRLEQAGALYCGDFLEEFSIGDSAGFEEWALLTREQLRAQAGDVLRQLTESRAGVENPAQVCDYARRWIALDPLNEEAHRRLMRALANTGQRSAALAQFEHCRRILHTELGIEPEPATMALYAELKRSAAPAPARHAPLPHPPLPLPATPLIDRERELAALADLLADPANRVITITGPGGVGKTRLAIHVAAANAACFADGVCFVSLAPVHDSAVMLSAIAQALGVPQNDAQTLEQLVHGVLAQRQMLLLLDNCEHLLPTVATLITAVLADAPQVAILATSRMALRLSQERRYQLAPLNLPSGDQTADAQLAQAPAVRLFVQRAQAARPTVELDYRAISALCRRLDGLPLAIELAATRARLLNPRELLARLEQRLPLLSGGPRDLPLRQQTLHATIDWSYQLLEPDQQALFRRLAVFAGGWTVVAAEAVASELRIENEELKRDHPRATFSIFNSQFSILDGLGALLDASLIIEMPSDFGAPRWIMLETIREYAHAQLNACGELEQTRTRHARQIEALAAQAATGLSGPTQLAWLQRFDTELDNLRAALSWCADHAIGTGLRIASDLVRYWNIRGRRIEGRSWLETLLERLPATNTPAPTSAERAYGLLISGMLAMFLNEFEAATHRLRESLALYEHLEDQQNIAWVLNNLGNVALQQGIYPEAERYYRESLALRRAINHTAGMAATLNNLAGVAHLQGDLAASKAYYDESLMFYQQIGDRVAAASVMGHTATILLQQSEYAQAQQLYTASHTIALELGDKPGLRQTLNGLGNVARMQQRYSEAIHYYRQGLAVSVEIHHIGAVSLGLFCCAAIAWAEEQAERAAILLGATTALNHSAQLVLDPEVSAEFDQHLAAVRSALDAATFKAAWARGQALSLEQAVALALDDSI